MSKKILGNVVGVPNPKSDWNQNDKTKADAILNKPTKLSQFDNDVGYLTDHQDISGKADKEHTHNADEVKIWNTTVEEQISSLTSYCDGLSEYKADKTEVANVQAYVDTVYDMTVANEQNKADKSEVEYLTNRVDNEIQPSIDSCWMDKADKPTIEALEDTSCIFEFSNTHNREKRLAEVSNISFTFGDGEYNADYTSGLSFDSGATPTAIDYTDSGILNWVGTDCTNVDGLSIFQPSANTHYDIVFYFNGTQFIGLVNGFVPATGNEAV